MVLKILKEKKGASMIFVLCVMLLLTSVCASVLVAASASSGAATRRLIHNRLVLFADSIHKNIMYSLQHVDGNPVETAEDRLWGQLLMAVYKANDPDYSAGTGLDDITDIEVSISSGSTLDAITIESLVFSFQEQNVNIFPMPESNGIPDLGIPRIPKTAEVSTMLLVTSTVTSGGKTLTTAATYEFTGGRLSDRKEEGTMAIINAGQWRLISYENQGS